ncbi:DUF6463 family protein [Nocardia rosealba]|uniref:DUF6463 family protein n=1 Tax=Nocardia TaxID=1817 RepID=UPI001CD991E4|nr:DUF6463 family protein [Nocardia rosealba]MCA2210068.1 DUF6463 family protein [Nocardia rosealba]
MITWAGRVLATLGAAHALAATMLGHRYFGQWFSFELWAPDADIAALPPEIGAFWMGPGSFGIPLMLLGFLITWMDRRGITPPVLLAVGLIAWTLLCAAIFEPAPWILATAASIQLLIAIRRPAAPRPAEARAGR